MGKPTRIAVLAWVMPLTGADTVRARAMRTPDSAAVTIAISGPKRGNHDVAMAVLLTLPSVRTDTAAVFAPKA